MKKKTIPSWRITLGLMGRAFLFFGAVATVTAFADAPAASASSVEEYLFLSKKGAKWVYDVTWDIKKEQRQATGKLTITNEGEVLFEGTKAIRFSWTYTSAGTISHQINFYVLPSPEGVLLVGFETTSGSTTSRSRLEPPVLWLKEPLQVGSAWVYQAKNIQTDGKTIDFRGRTTVQKQEQVGVPVGQFYTMRVVWEDSNAKATTWWAKGVGFVRREESYPSMRLVTELIEYSIPGKAPMVARSSTETGELQTKVKEPAKRTAGAPQDTAQQAQQSMAAKRTPAGAHSDLIPTIPMPKTSVGDRAEVINANTEKQLKSLIADMESKTGVRMVILTQEVPRQLVEQPDPATHYQTKLTTEWGLGGLQKHIFILLWISKHPTEERFYVRISSDLITDAELLTSLSKRIALYGRTRNYSQGIYSATSELAQQVVRQHEQKQAKAAAQSFIKKYHIQDIVSAETLNSNVFSYKGKRIAVLLAFRKMLSENVALFKGALDTGYLVVTGVPHTLLEYDPDDPYYTVAVEPVALTQEGVPYAKYLGFHKGNIIRYIYAELKRK